MKRILRVVSFLLLLTAIFTLLASCKQAKGKEKFTRTYIEYFDTVTTVIGYAESKGEFLEVAEFIEDRLLEYHKLYDAYHSATDDGYEEEYSGITTIKDINALVGDQHLVRKVDRKTIDLLLFAKEMYELTNGETNVAMGSVLKLWHDKREAAYYNPSEASLPEYEALQAASSHTDINGIVINEEESTVFLSDPDMLLDVGAIAKGYAVEMIARELAEMGVSGYAISAGGNVRLIGSKPGEENWSIGIENPDSYASYIETLSLSNKSVVTSGSYQRYYTVGDKTYHHIIDKDTLFPSVHFQSVSVITENSAVADALSTALFCMSLEDGMALVERIEGIEAVWLSVDGVKNFSSGVISYLS